MQVHMLIPGQLSLILIATELWEPIIELHPFDPKPMTLLNGTLFSANDLYNHINFCL
jgi:hypothetical protein